MTASFSADKNHVFTAQSSDAGGALGATTPGLLVGKTQDQLPNSGSDQLLLINDMCGYGKVAIAAMLPILSHLGFKLHNLPTALVSNTLDYPNFFIADTTDYIRNTLRIWSELGFSFDAIATGFIAGAEQATLISEYCRVQAARGVRIFVDPIMGDEGALYAGVPQERVGQLRELVAVADITYPNYTEACLLSDTPFSAHDNLTRNQAQVLVDKIRALGAKSVLVTSMCVEGTHCICGYDATRKSYLELPFDKVDVYFPGTGDIFSSVIVGRMLKGASLEAAAREAAGAVRTLIVRNAHQIDRSRGLPIEANLDLFPPRKAKLIHARADRHQTLTIKRVDGVK